MDTVFRQSAFLGQNSTWREKVKEAWIFTCVKGFKGTPPLHKFFQRIQKKILPNSFDKPRITVTPRPYKDITRKETSRPISLINRDIKSLHIILANQIQGYIKWVIYRDHTGFIPGIQDQLNIRKLISITHHINRLKDKNHATMSRDVKEAFDTSRYLSTIKLLTNRRASSFI